MRSDPFQERARVLAIEAGLDPDAKIDRPGQRPMPTWCLFRDAARKEQLARETAAVAADLAVKPQAAQYSPLKIFGKHDENTLTQMRNCMAVGNAVAGVICADGHLGYAQPVGGVIAYEKQISISGVGFDIGCGNMAVRLDTPFSAIEGRIGEIIRDVQKVISFGVGRTNDERVEHELFDDNDAWHESDMGAYRQKQPLRRPYARRGRFRLDRRSLRQPRTRPYQRDALPQGRWRPGRYERSAGGDRRG